MSDNTTPIPEGAPNLPEDLSSPEQAADYLTTLMGLILQFARVERITRHPDGKRLETDSDHSLSLGIICAQVASWLNMRRWRTLGYRAGLGAIFNTGLIAEFALVHDFPEVLDGDESSFGISDSAREAKKAREARAVKWLGKTLGTDSWLMVRLHQYEAQVLPEARLVRLIDKILPKICHRLNAGASLKAIGVNKAGIQEAHAKQQDRLAAEYPDLWPEVSPLFIELCERAEAVWED